MKNYPLYCPKCKQETLIEAQKWLTDVTEMKYGASGKAYLSAILDLADKSIVSFVIGHSNNNAFVFETFDIAHSVILGPFVPRLWAMLSNGL